MAAASRASRARPCSSTARCRRSACAFACIKRRRQMDEAGLVEVLVASPDRVAPRCAHFGICGGCSLQHLVRGRAAGCQRTPTARESAAHRQCSTRSGCLQPLRGPEWAYRRRARLGIKYVHKKGRVLAGFREREKPYIADIKRCEVLLAPLARSAAGVGGADRDPRAFGRKCRRSKWRRGSARRRWCFGCWKRPSAADLEKLAAFGAQRGLQIFLQTGRP